MKPFPPVSTRTMSELFTNKNKSGLTRDLIEALFPMFEEASAGAIAVDRETNITWINSSYSQLLGLVDPSHAIGKPVRKVIPSIGMLDLSPIFVFIALNLVGSLINQTLPSLGMLRSAFS